MYLLIYNLGCNVPPFAIQNEKEKKKNLHRLKKFQKDKIQKKKNHFGLFLDFCFCFFFLNFLPFYFYFLFFMQGIFVILGQKGGHCNPNGRLVGYINQIERLEGILQIGC